MQLHPPPAFGGGRGWCSESTVGLGMGVALRLQQPGLKGKDAPSRQMMCALEDGGAVQGTVGAALSMAHTTCRAGKILEEGCPPHPCSGGSLSVWALTSTLSSRSLLVPFRREMG